MELKEGYKQTEIGIIPQDWNYKSIIDLVLLGDQSIKIGPFGSALKKEYLTKTGYKVYGQENVYENDMSLGNRYINHEHYLKLKSCDIKYNDFLISMMGTIGRSFIVPNDIEKGIMDSHLLRLRIDTKKVDLNYLLQIFQSPIVFSQIKQLSVGGIMDGLSSKIIKKIKIPYSNIKEQTAIVNALSDTDAWIQSLTHLIEKKRMIKQGTMQTLLNPYEKGCLKEGWVEKKLSDVLHVGHGKSQHEVIDDNGTYPILASGGEIGRAVKFLYDKPSVLIGRKGTIDVPQYMDKPFWTIDTLFYTEVILPNDAKYLFYQFCLIDWYSYNEASGVPSLSAKTIQNIDIIIPTSGEQSSIANVLTQMDSEISALESKLSKAKQIKQGMMQNLLTGKIRLV